MRSVIINSLLSIKHQPCSSLLLKKCIHSGLRMTTQELATALRPFIFNVHPDRFWNYPKEKNTNELSLKRLNEFFGDKNDGKINLKHYEEIITFYIRNNDSSSSTTSSNNSKFEKIHIKLNSKENIPTTVHRILSQCSLPTDYLKKISQQETRPKTIINNDETIINNNDDGGGPKPYGRYENEFYYSKDLFDEIQAEFYKTRMDTNFSEWLRENYQLATRKLEASLPIRIDLEKLKQELIDELNLIDLQWNCDWTFSHIRGALKNLNVLCKQYPEDMKILNKKIIIFSRHTGGVGLKGQVILNIDDVRINWLSMIRSIKRYDTFVKNIPIAEKQLSDLLGGIQIVHPEYNIWNAKKYFNQLERLIRSVREYEFQQNGFPSDWNESSLNEYRLIVEFDSGPLMLSPTGDFIIPACCPVSLLIHFIQENLFKASQMLDKEEFNLEYERIIRQQCLEKFQLNCLEKDVNITPEQMINFCKKILDNSEKFKDYLKNLHLQVSMYYTVMHDGQICVPFNFIV